MVGLDFCIANKAALGKVDDHLSPKTGIVEMKNGRKKALRTNKPDSVSPPFDGTPSFIWDRPHGRPLAAYPPARASSPSVPITRGITGVHDISTHKVYPPHLLPSGAVRSYRTFSPLPRLLRTVIFCDTLCTSAFAEAPPVRWCGALRCPDFPPALPLRTKGAGSGAGDGVARSAGQR